MNFHYTDGFGELKASDCIIKRCRRALHTSLQSLGSTVFGLRSLILMLNNVQLTTHLPFFMSGI